MAAPTALRWTMKLVKLAQTSTPHQRINCHRRFACRQSQKHAFEHRCPRRKQTSNTSVNASNTSSTYLPVTPSCWAVCRPLLWFTRPVRFSRQHLATIDVATQHADRRPDSSMNSS
jgi:hypothetical protein